MDGFDAVRAADELCRRAGRAEFLSVDLDLVRALEDVLAALPEDERARRARVAARLALELRSDPTTLERRRALLTAARRDAERAADAAASVEAELAGVHALWEPPAAADRLAAAERAVGLARAAGLPAGELEARLARIDALLGLGRLVDAEVELGLYVRLTPPDDPDARLFAASRRATVLAACGRFEEAERCAAEAIAAAADSERGDLHQVLLAVRGTIARQRGTNDWTDAEIDAMVGLVVRLPGQHHDALLARMLLEVGREQEARVELARALASLRAGQGPMWLIALFEAAHVAAALGRNSDRVWVLDRLASSGADFATYTLLFGGSIYASRAALALALGDLDAALAHADRAVADLDAIGAIPLAARARRLRASVLRALGRDTEADADERDAHETAEALGLVDLVDPVRREVWVLKSESGGWQLVAGPETAMLTDSRGLEHLRVLLANPRREVAALTLEAGQEIPVESSTPMLDDAARSAYRNRLAQIDSELEAAERRADPAAAATLEPERAALVAELKRAAGLGGRIRRDADAGERARLNVTRNIRRAIDRITEVAPQAGLHLAASVRTGNVCRYEPAPGGPEAWET